MAHTKSATCSCGSFT